MARTLDFTDGFTTETEPSGDTFKTRGLKNYTTEAAFVTAKGSAAASGDAFYNSSLNVVKYHNGTSWQTAATDGDLDTHIADTANPHSVTATQVGLGNVDNTSDATKNSATATLTNKTLTSPIINTSVSGTAVLDEDNMVSNSATQLATQQSIKAYVDSQVGGSLSVTSKTAAYTILASDDVVLGDTSGGAFTLTLPPASSNSGKVYVIKYVDSGFVNALTVDGDASETIDGSTTTTLNTNGETLRIVSDGSNWVTLSRTNIGNWVSFTPTGTWTTNTTYSGKWRRVGDTCEYMVTASTSGAPTGGNLIINLPTGHVIDTAKLTTTDDDSVLGQSITNNSGVEAYESVVTYYTTTSVTPLYNSAHIPNFIGTTNPFTFATGDSVTCIFKAPITGWNA